MNTILAIHVALSPFYLFLIAGLIYRLKFPSVLVRLIFAMMIVLTMSLLVTLILILTPRVAGLVVALLGSVSLVAALFLLYPLIARFLSAVVGIPFTPKYPRPSATDITKDLLLELKHLDVSSPISLRGRVLTAVASIVALAVGLVITRNVIIQYTLDFLATIIAGSGIFGLLLGRIMSVLYEKKTAMTWMNALNLAFSIAVCFASGWVIGAISGSQISFGNVIVGLCTAGVAGWGVIVWQMVLWGQRYYNRT
jgi:hypothetical protein